MALNVIIYALTTDSLVRNRMEVVDQFAVHGGNLNPVNLLAHMFLHAELFHLLGNLWFLYLFGFAVEGRLRAAKFLVVYFGAGIIGALLHIVIASGGEGAGVPMIGASGAIMGTLGAALFMFPYSQVNFFYWFMFFFYGVTTWAMMWVAAYYVGLDLLGVFLGGGPVANWAHLGGVGGGILVCWILGAKRDSQKASDAKAMYSETKDLRYLSPAELAAMVEQNKDDSTLVLNWMIRSMRDSKGVSPECRASFGRLLPQIMQKESPQAVGWALAGLSHTPGTVKPSTCLNAALRLDKVGEPTTALQLYEAVLRDPSSKPDEIETALYHIGLNCELKLGNADRAAWAYRELMNAFPMGTFAEHARLHLARMGR